MSAIAVLFVFAALMEMACGHVAGAGVLFVGAGLLAAMVVRRALR